MICANSQVASWLTALNERDKLKAGIYLSLINRRRSVCRGEHLPRFVVQERLMIIKLKRQAGAYHFFNR